MTHCKSKTQPKKDLEKGDWVDPWGRELVFIWAWGSHSTLSLCDHDEQSAKAGEGQLPPGRRKQRDKVRNFISLKRNFLRGSSRRKCELENGQYWWWIAVTDIMPRKQTTSPEEGLRRRGPVSTPPCTMKAGECSDWVSFGYYQMLKFLLSLCLWRKIAFISQDLSVLNN